MVVFLWLAFLPAMLGICAAIFIPAVVRIQHFGVRSLATVFLFLGSYVLVGAFYILVARPAMAQHSSDCWPDVMDELAPDPSRSGWN